MYVCVLHILQVAVLSEARPRFSFVHAPIEGKGPTPYGVTQASYRITVSRVGDEANLLWDSGDVNSSKNFLIEYGGAALTPFTRCVSLALEMIINYVRQFHSLYTE